MPKAPKRYYTSTRKRFTIFRPSTLVPVMYQGTVAHEKIDNPPIEFRNGRYSTNDPKVIEYLEQHPSYEVDFFPLAVVEEQIKAAGIDREEEDTLEQIGGVTNRNLAIQALVERGVDPDLFDRTVKKEAIIGIALQKGFEFTGW